MNKLKNINTIIFDLDGVLIEHDYTDEAKKMCEALGIPYSSEIDEPWNNFWNDFYTNFKDKKVTIELVISNLLEYVEYFKIYGKSIDELYEAIELKETIVKFHDYAPLLEKLQNKGYKIVSLTDWFYDRQTKVLDDLGYLDYFEKVYAFDNWYLKPDKRSVGRIIDNNDKDSFVIVGDSLIADVATGNNAGIKSIWFNQNNKVNNTSYTPDYEINDLNQLLDIL